MRIAQKAILLASPAAWRTVVTLLAALLTQMAVATPPAFSGERVSKWLKRDANEEPYEATLADGTVLKLETYGDEYDAYEYRPPLTGNKVDLVLGTDRGPNLGWGGLAIDRSHQTIYWIEGTSKVSRIMRARLNGAGAGPLMDFNELSPTHVTPDPVHGKLYWHTGGLLNPRRAIYRTDLNAKNARPLIRDIAHFRDFAIEPGQEQAPLLRRSPADPNRSQRQGRNRDFGDRSPRILNRR